MILHAVLRPRHPPSLPWIVWLHGFLGSHREWLDVSQYLNDWPQIWVDLPGHGGSVDIRAGNFSDVDRLLRVTLTHYNILTYWLVGYSLGGRVAMYHACQPASVGVRGLVVEGSHPGLSCQAERETRARSDKAWVDRLCHEDLQTVLHDWYRQPVFHSLSDVQRRELVALRLKNNPHALAEMLEATSLSRQPDLRKALSQLTVPFYALCGERDDKFRPLCAALSCSSEWIADAGHNAHRDAPVAFGTTLLNLFRLHDL